MLTASGMHARVRFWPHSLLSHMAGARRASSQAFFQISASPGTCWYVCNLSPDSIFEYEFIWGHREVEAFHEMLSVHPIALPKHQGTLQRK